jgi:membrane protease YdiL (CAAX protease family)
MTDPTELVITGSYAVALGVFATFALLRLVSSGKSRPAITEDSARNDGSSPSEPPGELILQPPALPVGRVPVWFYRPVDLVGAGFVFLVFTGMFLMSQGAPADKLVLTPEVLVVNIGFQFMIAGVVVILAMWRISVNTWLGLRWSSWPWVFLIAPAGVVLMWVVFGGLQVSGYVEWMESLGVETVQDTVRLLQESKDPVILGLMAAAAVIVAPLCEEIVFRGYFYPVLKRFSGAWPAAICSAIVFGAAHGQLTALLPLFIFGLLLVFIYERTGSIWAPIAVHLCFNSATVVIQIAARHFDIPLQPAP